jgi:hypothetical protein
MRSNIGLPSLKIDIIYNVLVAVVDCQAAEVLGLVEVILLSEKRL